jgi:ADP-ribosyl-[dinitrogen reductase] hydrolase
VSVRSLAAATLPPGAYWVEPERLIAGAYPGHVDPAYAEARVVGLLELGIDWFLDLTWPDELPPYAQLLPSPYQPGRYPPVTYSRRPIRDHDLPRHAAQMVEILDELEQALAGGHRVYVHCREGIGRTGTVIGCHLARRLGSGTAALESLDRLWIAGGRDRDWPRTPETDAQCAYVRDWREPRRAPARGAEPLPTVELADRLRDRYRGLLLGLALGDALAAPVQHRRPGTFTPVGDLLGGGPYDLPRGGWSDDTAVALLLAESLLEQGAFDAREFVARLARWQRDGYGSATGQCLGITATTARALAQAQWSGNPFAGSHDPARADREPLVRAGIVAAWALDDPERAIELAAEVARPTHQAPVALDACRYFAALVVGALQGAPKAELLAPDFSPVPGLWARKPLKREVARIAAGDWRAAAAAPDLAAYAAGSAVGALRLVLRALAAGHGYRDTVLTAVNLGLDADANGALAGQLAGALYGAGALPPHWVASLAEADRVAGIADRLLTGALGRIAAI